MVLESSGWTMYDTVAAVLALVLLSGYHLHAVQYAVVTALNVVLAPVATLLPFSVFFFGLAGVTGSASTVFRNRLQDSEQLDQLQSRIEELQAELSAEEQTSEELTPQHHEFISNWVAMMKLQLRPMVWSMLVTLPIFLWLRWAMMAPTAAVVPVALTLPVVGAVPLSATLIGPIKVWIVWYIGGTISTSMLSRRVLARAS